MRTISDPAKTVTVIFTDRGKQADGVMSFLSEYVVNGDTIPALFVADSERHDMMQLGEDRLTFDQEVLAAHDLNLSALTHVSPIT
jgi:hypothetical protein